MSGNLTLDFDPNTQQPLSNNYYREGAIGNNTAKAGHDKAVLL